jgi:hypothetical protein
MVIVDNSTLLISRCGDVIINTTKFGDVLHVPEVGPNLLSIYHIAHTNKKVEFWPNQLVVKDMNDGFEVVAFGYCDESNHMYKSRKPLLHQNEKDLLL